MLAAMQPNAWFASQTNATQLPSPSGDAAGSLMAALEKRKSTRSFCSRPLPRQMLSNPLWTAFGINRPNGGFRTAPSPKNSQEIAIYAATVDGLYLYNAHFHQLVQLNNTDIRRFCGKQGFVAKAPLNLIFVADFSKLGSRNEEKKWFYAAADTGFISQNVYLFCAATGLGTVVRNWIDRAVLSKKMGLDNEQKIILAQTVGYPQ